MEKTNSSTKRSLLEVGGGLSLLAFGYVLHWWQTRNDKPDAVKKANATKDKEHAEDLRRVEEQRQKEFQMFCSIIDYFINNKDKD